MPDSSSSHQEASPPLDSNNHSAAVTTAAAAAAAAASAASAASRKTNHYTESHTFNNETKNGDDDDDDDDSSSDHDDEEEEEDPEIIVRRVTVLRRQQSERFLNVEQVQEVIRAVWPETPAAADAATNSDGMNAHARLELLLREDLRLAASSSNNNNPKDSSGNKKPTCARKRRKAWKRAHHLQRVMDRKIHEVKKLQRRQRQRKITSQKGGGKDGSGDLKNTHNDTMLLVASSSSSSKTTAVVHDDDDAGNVLLTALNHGQQSPINNTAVACSSTAAAAADSTGTASSNSGSDGTCNNNNMMTMIVDKNAAVPISAAAVAVDASASASVMAPAAAAAAAAGSSSDSKYSAARVRERIATDGMTVAPATAPRKTNEGLYQRPAGRGRKGMEWDAVRGIWVVATAASSSQPSMAWDAVRGIWVVATASSSQPSMAWDAVRGIWVVDTASSQPAVTAAAVTAASQPAPAASCPAPVTKANSNQPSSTTAAQSKQPAVIPASTTTTASLPITNKGILPVTKQPQSLQQQQQELQKQASAKSGALKNILHNMATTTAATTTTTTTTTNNSNYYNVPIEVMPVWAAMQPAPPAAELSSLPPPPPYTKRSIAKKSSSNDNDNINNNKNASAVSTTKEATAPAVPSLPQPPVYTRRSSNATTTSTSTSHNATSTSSSASKQQSSSSSSSAVVAPLTVTATVAVPPEHSRRNSAITTANVTLTRTKPVVATPVCAASSVARVAQLPQQPPATTATTTQHKATTTSTVAKVSANNALTPAATKTAPTGTTTTGVATKTTTAPPAQNRGSSNAAVQAASPTPLPAKQRAQSVTATTTARAENTTTPAPVRRGSSTGTASTMPTTQHNSTFLSSSLPPTKPSTSSNGKAATTPSASSAPKPSTATLAAAAAATTNLGSANSTSQLKPTPPPAKYPPLSNYNWAGDMTNPTWERVRVNIEGYNLSQNEWVDFVRNSLSDAPPHLKGYLRTLAKNDNVPRKQPQFANHMHTALNLRGAPGIATSNRLWDFLKGELEKKTAIAVSKQKVQLSASQGGGGRDRSSSAPRHEQLSEAEQSQEACRRLALSIDSAPSYLRSHLQTIVDLKTVPRSKEELLDVAKKTLNLRDKALDEVWNYLVKHVYSGERPPQHAKTAVPVQPTALRGALPSINSGAKTTAALPLSFRGHSSSSSVGVNVTAAPAAARGYSFSSMPDRFEPATRAVSDIASAALAADQARIRALTSLEATGTTAGNTTSSISRAPKDAETASSMTRTASAQAIRPSHALNTDSGNSTHCATAKQNSESLKRQQGAKTIVSTASSVAAAQLPLEAAVSRQKLTTMKIVADDQKQPFSGFHPQYQTTVRNEALVTFLKEQNAAAIPSETLCTRMEWDPFWDPTFVLAIDLTGKVEYPKGKTWARTAAQVTVDLEKSSRENRAKFSHESKCEWGKRKTAGDLKEGESRLLLKMIPLHPPSGTGKKAKADGHLWPKGTFLQLTTGVTTTRIRIQQRKQQQHNERLWKDMSNYLDLTELVSSNSSRQPFKIEMICHEEEPFFICVAFCRYRSADAIFKMLTTPTSISPIRRVFESKEEARRKIVNLASSRMIVLDDDDGAPEKEEHAGVFSFSLVDSYSKKLIKTPVRGRRCAHFQCFDLEQFIVGNSMVSGNRWRCLVCENFIPISELELCGLTHSILKEYAGQASSTLNRIEFRSNGTHQLLNESNNRKRPAVPNPQESSNVGDAKRARTADIEVIDLN